MYLLFLVQIVLTFSVRLRPAPWYLKPFCFWLLLCGVCDGWTRRQTAAVSMRTVISAQWGTTCNIYRSITHCHSPPFFFLTDTQFWVKLHKNHTLNSLWLPIIHRRRRKKRKVAVWVMPNCWGREDSHWISDASKRKTGWSGWVVCDVTVVLQFSFCFPERTGLVQGNVWLSSLLTGSSCFLL